METDELHAEVSKLKMLMSEEEQKMQRYKVRRINNKSHLSSLGDLTDGLVWRVLASSGEVGGSNPRLGHTKNLKLKMVVFAACLALSMKEEPRNIIGWPDASIM